MPMLHAQFSLTTHTYLTVLIIVFNGNNVVKEQYATFQQKQIPLITSRYGTP